MWESAVKLENAWSARVHTPDNDIKIRAKLVRVGKIDIDTESVAAVFFLMAFTLKCLSDGWLLIGWQKEPCRSQNSDRLLWQEVISPVSFLPYSIKTI